jgi:hypothetical protein
MGHNMAVDLAESVIDIHQSITIHLRSNHYPPVPYSMVQPCIDAIYACDEQEYDKLIELPEGVEWRGQSSAPAHAIVEGHHLEAWLYSEGDEQQ